MMKLPYSARIFHAHLFGILSVRSKIFPGSGPLIVNETAPSPRFWHIRSQHNQLLVESYCLVCFKFVGASKLAFNLTLVELAHRLVCKSEDSAEALPGTLPEALPPGSSSPESS